MMNKLKTTRVHLLKFLFLLPLVAVLLLAFRDKFRQNNNKVITMAGIIVDADTHEPLSNVQLSNDEAGIKAITDSKGYYKFEVPFKNLPFNLVYFFSKQGYEDHKFNITFQQNKEKDETEIPFRGGMIITGLTRTGTRVVGFDHALSLSSRAVAYNEVKAAADDVLSGNNRDQKLKALMQGNQRVYFEIDNHKYVVTSAGGYASLDANEVSIELDGKAIAGDELNSKFKRETITSVTAINLEGGKGILRVFTKEGLQQAELQSGIAGQPGQDKYVTADAFLNTHPEVKLIIVQRDFKKGLIGFALEFKDKKRKTENYDIHNALALQKAISKYGNLPLQER